MRSSALSVWQARWDALRQHLDFLERGLLDAGDDVPRKVILLKLISGLITYGDAHFQFFRDGLKDEKFLPEYHDKHHNNKHVVLSPEFILRQVIERVATDTRVIMQAVEQRVFYTDHQQPIIEAYPNGKATGQSRTILQTLERADKLAYAALKPALLGGILSGKWTALTYFMRDAQVRVIPYANVALVGIPLTCVQQPRDFLAIPHEVGHSVYWNAYAQGTMQRKIWREIEHSLVDDKTGKPIVWLQKWAEEIFADAYGALIAGPSVALSFQQLAQEDDNHQFEEDDGHHPIPLARAHVYFKVLKQVGASDVVIKKLIERWHEILKQRKYHNTQFERSADEVDTEIDNLWQLIDPEKQFDVWDDYETMDPDIAVKVNKTKLVGGLNKVITPVLSQLDKIGGASNPWAGLRAHNPSPLTTSELGGIESLLDEIIGQDIEGLDEVAETVSWNEWATSLETQHKPTEGDDTLYYKWLAILRADGWTTEGPHGRPNENQ